MSLASVGYVGYGIEVTEGLTVAPSIYLPVSAFSFDSTNEYITPEQLRGTRDKYISMPSAYSVSGSMDMELVPLGIRPLFKSAFAMSGAYTPGAYQTTAYATVITPGDAGDKTFTFESSAADILVMRYGGIRVNTLEISAAFNEIVTASFGLEGTTRVKMGSPTSETYGAVEPFHFTGASITINGTEVGNVKSFNFNVGNNLERIGTLKKTRNWKRTAHGVRDIGLSCQMDFTDTTDYDLFLAETEFAVKLHMEGDFANGVSGPKHTIQIDIPRVSWNAINAPLNAGDFIEQSVEANILRPLAGTPICTVTIINSENTAI